MDEDRPVSRPTLQDLTVRHALLERRVAGQMGAMHGVQATLQRIVESLYDQGGLLESVAALREAQRICNMNQEAEERRRSMQVTVLASVLAGMLVALVFHTVVNL